MLGHTHMGLGAVGAVLATPLILHEPWVPMRQFLGGHWGAMPHIVIAQAILVVATVLGATLPDLDQRDSLAARKVEFLGGIPVFAMLAALVIVLHQTTSLVAWGAALVFSILFSTERNFTRWIGLALMGAGLLYLGWDKRIPLAAAILLALWIVGAMFTAHRTFTHSLVGLALFTVAVHLMLPELNAVHLDLAAIGLPLGYALHMAEDAIAGGVPLLWPWGQRQGIHWVKTGGGWDILIGNLSILVFAALAIF